MTSFCIIATVNNQYEALEQLMCHIHSRSQSLRIHPVPAAASSWGTWPTQFAPSVLLRQCVMPKDKSDRDSLNDRKLFLCYVSWIGSSSCDDHRVLKKTEGVDFDLNISNPFSNQFNLFFWKLLLARWSFSFYCIFMIQLLGITESIYSHLLVRSLR